VPGPSIIVLASRIGAGKSTLARALAEVSNLPIVSFGQYVKSITIERKLSLNRENLQTVGEQLVANDPKEFTRRALASVDFNIGAIVDGLRHQTILAEIRSLAPGLPVVVVFIKVADEIRLERLTARGMSAEEIRRANNHAMELALEERLLPLADLVLDGTTPAETNAQTVAEHICALLD
jgi:dephospho-CoA kinase